MNRDELLYKLAMELGEYPHSCKDPLPDGFYFFGPHVGTRAAEVIITEKDWLQRRTELINKPSWDDAPEWAEYLVQAPKSKDWFWVWGRIPKTMTEGGHGLNSWLIDPMSAQHASDGETPTGHDWKETLECRPSHNRELNAITSSLTNSQAQEVAELTGWCSDGMPCSDGGYCDGCPNEPRCQGKSDGSTASYYVLPDGAKELQDLISYRNMNAQDGEIFRAIYRKGRASHSDELRDAKKVLFYAQAEVDRLEKYA